MSDLASFSEIWLMWLHNIYAMIYNSFGWVGMCILGFFALRLFVFSISFLLKHRNKDYD